MKKQTWKSIFLSLIAIFTLFLLGACGQQSGQKSYLQAINQEKKKQQKRGVKSTTVKVTDPKTGKVTEKNLSASEMNKCRLEYARQLDAERYKDERTVPLSELNKQDKE